MQTTPVSILGTVFNKKARHEVTSEVQLQYAFAWANVCFQVAILILIDECNQLGWQDDKCNQLVILSSLLVRGPDFLIHNPTNSK